MRIYSLLISRPFISMNTSLEIYTYYLYKHLLKISLDSNKRSILPLLLPLKSKAPRFFYKIPYGVSISPLFYDYIMPSLMLLKKNLSYISSHNGGGKVIIHYLHHILTGSVLLQKLILNIYKNPINIITTFHHVPEAFDSTYSFLIETRINEFSRYIKSSTYLNILKNFLHNHRLTLYGFHDIETFKSAIRFSNYYISVSSLTTKELMYYAKKFNKKIYTINPGLTININSIKNKLKNKNKQSLGLNRTRKITIGYIGAHNPRKATFMLIPLGIVLKENNFKAKIEVWGSGPLLHSLKLLSSKLGLNNIVIFKGNFKRDQLPDILQSFDMLFLPTIKEGFGLPIIEATALGIPVILYADAKVPYETKKYCTLIKSLDEMPGIIESIDELKYNAINNAKRVIKEFDWANSTKKLINMYLNLD